MVVDKFFYELINRRHWTSLNLCKWSDFNIVKQEIIKFRQNRDSFLIVMCIYIKEWYFKNL